MKLSNIIFQGEIINNELSLDIDFHKLTTESTQADADSVLILTESNKNFHPTEEKVPCAVICSANTAVDDKIPTFRVDNIRVALSRAYYRFEAPDLSKMIIIGVTGTNGKSSTTGFIYSILRQLGHKVGLIGTGRIELDGEVILGAVADEKIAASLGVERKAGAQRAVGDLAAVKSC